MTVEEFRKKVKPFAKLSIGGKDFLIREVVKFRFDDGSFYFKCFLNDDYVFADDLNEGMFLLVREVKTLFVQPFGKELEFDAKKFRFIYSAHAVAEEIHGKEIFKKGIGESFWDYKSEGGNYLSLGLNDQTKKRMDFYGSVIDNSSVEINDNKL